MNELCMVGIFGEDNLIPTMEKEGHGHFTMFYRNNSDYSKGRSPKACKLDDSLEISTAVLSLYNVCGPQQYKV